MQNKQNFRVLGIDPGYDRLGLAIVDRENNKANLLLSKCIQTSKKDDFYSRLLFIYKEIEKVIEKYKPDLMAIETLFLSKNQKTAMRVSEARGALLVLAKMNDIKIQELTPLEVKMAITGDGKSDKYQVIKMVKLMTKMDGNKRLDDEYDAIAIALISTFPQV
jgi:crossover junction endodeoxyribonuclease RuvC